MPKPNRSPTPYATSYAASELEALISAASPGMADPARPPAPGSNLPNRPLLELALATRAVAGWYEAALGTAAQPASEAPTSLDQVVQHHLTVRREWEKREAINLATWMSSQATPTRQTTGQTARHATKTPATTTRRALLIDDSSDILVTVGAFLDAYGFDVTAVSDGETALRLLNDQEFHLLVTDHAMPGMTGRDLVLEACHQDPALRAMIITGYPGLHELKSLPAGVTVLAKPFRRAELFSRLRLLFDRPDHDLDAQSANRLCSPSF